MAELRAVMAKLDDQGDPDKRLRKVYEIGVRDGVSARAGETLAMAFLAGEMRELGEAEIAGVARDVMEALR